MKTVSRIQSLSESIKKVSAEFKEPFTKNQLRDAMNLIAKGWRGDLKSVGRDRFNLEWTQPGLGTLSLMAHLVKGSYKGGIAVKYSIVHDREAQYESTVHPYDRGQNPDPVKALAHEISKNVGIWISNLLHLNPEKVPEKAPEKAPGGEAFIQDVTSFLKGLKTKTGGKPRYVDFDRKEREWEIEPAERVRLDHYKGPRYYMDNDEDDDNGDWDDEGWNEDYGGPLYDQYMDALSKRFEPGIFQVDIGDKGHVVVSLTSKGMERAASVHFGSKGNGAGSLWEGSLLGLD